MGKIDVTMLREKLLTHLRKQGVLGDAHIADAFKQVPRHLFIPDVPFAEAYLDKAIAIKRDVTGVVISSISQPTMIAIMLNQMGLQEGDNVLEIGTATGYNAALMQAIVKDSGRVTSVELDGDLVDMARHNLSVAHQSQVLVVHADGAGGYAPRAAYDHILSTASIWDVPPAWMSQLKTQGSIVAPLWVDGLQFSAVLTAQEDGTLYSDDNRPCSFVNLRGESEAPRHWKSIGRTGFDIYANEINTIDPVALDLLLRDDYAINNLDARLSQTDYWFGFQIYLMLNVAPDYQFISYSVPEGVQSYSLTGRGMGLLTPGSAVFAPYDERGVLHAYGGTDAVLELQRKFDEWQALNRPGINHLHIRLTPRDHEMPQLPIRGKIYTRRYNRIHIWLEPDL